MDIGTDKLPLADRKGIPHHMLDVVDPDLTYTAGQWKQAVLELIPAIQARGNIPVIVGGTGLYIDMVYKNYALPELAPQRDRRAEQLAQEEREPGRLYRELQRLDPAEATKHHPHSTRYLIRALEIVHFTGQTKSALSAEHPVPFPLMLIGLWRNKEDTNLRINARIKQMLTQGLIAEVQGLLDRGYTLQHTALQGIGYKEIVQYLQGDYDLDKAIELLKRNSHRYAKRQRSRFRRYIMDSKVAPKEGVTYKVFGV